MGSPCLYCGSTEWRSASPPRTYRHIVPELGSPYQTNQACVCAGCGHGKAIHKRWTFNDHETELTEVELLGLPDIPDTATIQPILAMVAFDPKDDGSPVLATYNARLRTDTGEILPLEEARLHSGMLIGRHGDPELMATFAERYLMAYRAIAPTCGTPVTLATLMPALNLLVTAIELAAKAHLWRSGTKVPQRHELAALYDLLDAPHRAELDSRFARSAPCERLTAVNVAPPSVAEVLETYDASPGGTSTYMNTRYLGEPPNEPDKAVPLKSLDTPIPVFLPHIADSFVATFRFFDGAARLRRRGGDILFSARTPPKDNPVGDWGLVPASLNLVVVEVHGSSLDCRPWKTSRPLVYSADEFYSGWTRLFFPADLAAPDDGETEIDGLECRVWRHGRLGMHLRDLYRLADALERESVAPQCTERG